MGKKVALVGHCGPDSSYLRMAVSSVDREISVLAVDDEEALQQALAGGVELLLVNRTLDYGFLEDGGVELIERIRAQHRGVKTMLVSNYPDAQAAAVAAGALPGFGKREIGTPKVKQVLQSALAEPSAKAPKQAIL
jgi:two-component system, chemotaxis family, chemotaxis protein CheY